MPGVALDDYVHARLIVVWGTNPSATGIHLVPHRAGGAGGAARKLVVVDPRRTPLAKQADLHLAPRPGRATSPLALAVHPLAVRERRRRREFLAAHATGADELRRRAAPWTLGARRGVAGVPGGGHRSLRPALRRERRRR